MLSFLHFVPNGVDKPLCFFTANHFQNTCILFVNCASFISVGEYHLNRNLTSPRYERTINMSTHILVRDYHTSDLFNVCNSFGIIWIEIVYHKQRKEGLQWQQYTNDVKTLSNKAIILPADTFTCIAFHCYVVIFPCIFIVLNSSNY